MAERRWPGCGPALFLVMVSGTIFAWPFSGREFGRHDTVMKLVIRVVALLFILGVFRLIACVFSQVAGAF